MTSHSKQRVDSLLNPCNCKSIWKCRCRAQPEHGRSNMLPFNTASMTPQNGLVTLARAAALRCGSPSSPSNTTSKSTLTGLTTNFKRRPSRPSTPNSFSKRRKYIPANHQRKQTVPGPSLPPIQLSSPSASTSSHQVPDFPTIPPISTIASIAGSGCTCGLHCACPGCTEHRGEENVSNDTDCASGCGTCVDWQDGIGLPMTAQLSATGDYRNTSIIYQFLARAAALPLPPQNRYQTNGIDIDPMNMVVYPANLFSNHDIGGTTSATAEQWRGAFNMKGREAAFGLVKIPKLECCGGHCGCPEDGCNCRKSCSGRCGDHEDWRRSAAVIRSVGFNEQASPQVIAPPAPRSCCAKRPTTGS